MTEKELHKLKRSDFLQLLITQSKDMAAVQTRLNEASETLDQLRTANELQTAKLDEKDELIERLIERLKEKDETISSLMQENEDIKAELRDPGKAAPAETAAAPAKPAPQPEQPTEPGPDDPSWPAQRIGRMLQNLHKREA